MSILQLITNPIVFEEPARNDRSGLKLTARRYATTSPEFRGLTLIFTHCIGGHKEQWQPTIEYIFLQQSSKDKHHQIREIISFDWQNHGDAAAVNEEALKSRPGGVSISEWASAIASFVQCHLAGHRIVAIGHSAGAAAIMLTPAVFSLNKIPYLSILLIEPTMLPEEVFGSQARVEETEWRTKAAAIRRDTWANKQEATLWLSKRPPWKLWDPRVIQTYIEDGLRTLVSADGQSRRVITKCDRMQESVSYGDVEGYLEATKQFGRLCHMLPIHIIFGTRNDFVPAYVQDLLIDSSKGRKPASVTRVAGAGHLVVQEKPEDLAGAICQVLDTVECPPSARL